MRRYVPVVGFFDVDTILRDVARRPPAGLADVFARLAEEDTAVVLCSSWTRAELQRLQQECALRYPFICEAGSAVFVPSGYFRAAAADARQVPGYQVLEFGPAHDTIVETLHRVARRLNIPVRGSSEMSIEEVAHEQEVPLLQARLATLREYGELFRVDDNSPQARIRLANALRRAHLHCSSRAGIDHVRPAVAVGQAAARLRAMYERELGEVITVAAADLESDGTIATAVDYAFRVRQVAAVSPPARGARRNGDVIEVTDLAGVVEETIALVRRIRAGVVH